MKLPQLLYFEALRHLPQCHLSDGTKALPGWGVHALLCRLVALRSGMAFLGCAQEGPLTFCLQSCGFAPPLHCAR